VATVSNIRPERQKPDSAAGQREFLNALPFPAALLDDASLVAAANAHWLDAYPASMPGAALEDTFGDTHPAPQGLLVAIAETLSGARRSFSRETGRYRFTVSACARGALILREDLSPYPDTAAQPQEQRMETVGRLAGGVAHDFANILTLIAGYGELLLNRIGNQDPLRPELEEIREAANRGARLTSQLLDFTRGLPPQLQPISLNAITAAIERMLRPIIGEQFELRTSLLPNLGKVVADPGQMEQVMMNLILNARDAMPRGGRICIETSNGVLDEETARDHCMAPGPCVILSISDTGQGIEASALPHVFEPFFTTKEKGKGTGLGLSTVHRIILESGGDVWVESEPGCGATFFICLPSVRQPSKAPAVTVDTAIPAPHSAGGETILLVEDEDGVRRLLAHILHKYGYHVLEASDGEEALQIFERQASEIQLVLTDIVMPRMSGRELAERLIEKRRNTRLIFMSGYTGDTLVQNGELGPGLSFLQKPLRPEVLAGKLREALDSPALPFNPR
jgi:signal transduction histidine kinase